MESLDEAKRRGERDIPPMGKIKKIVYAPEWGDKFDYPLEDLPVADYYVEYEHIASLGAFWLIEASKKNLHKEIKQLEASANFFKQKNINVNGYLIVLDELSRRSKQKYQLKPYTAKPLKIVYEKIDYSNTKEYKICSKPLFVVFRHEFGRFKK